MFAKQLDKGDRVRLASGDVAEVLRKAQGIRIMLAVRGDAGDTYIDELVARERDGEPIIMTPAHKRQLQRVRSTLDGLGF